MGSGLDNPIASLLFQPFSASKDASTEYIKVNSINPTGSMLISNNSYPTTKSHNTLEVLVIIELNDTLVQSSYPNKNSAIAIEGYENIEVDNIDNEKANVTSQKQDFNNIVAITMEVQIIKAGN